MLNMAYWVSWGTSCDLNTGDKDDCKSLIQLFNTLDSEWDRRSKADEPKTRYQLGYLSRYLEPG